MQETKYSLLKIAMIPGLQILHWDDAVPGSVLAYKKGHLFDLSGLANASVGSLDLYSDAGVRIDSNATVKYSAIGHRLMWMRYQWQSFLNEIAASYVDGLKVRDIYRIVADGDMRDRGFYCTKYHVASPHGSVVLDPFSQSNGFVYISETRKMKNINRHEFNIVYPMIEMAFNNRREY